jgi:DNA-binding transcriptional MerR regulator
VTLKIGEFSRLARVSVKALRLYDQLGLLRPARTDALTGYRYYSSEQLPRLNAVLALKELGFSLEQVQVLLDEGSSLERARDAGAEARRGPTGA